MVTPNVHSKQKVRKPKRNQVGIKKNLQQCLKHRNQDLLMLQALPENHQEEEEETTLQLQNPRNNWLGRNPQPF
jgi:DnaJ-domain-containing protein 1